MPLLELLSEPKSWHLSTYRWRGDPFQAILSIMVGKIRSRARGVELLRATEPVIISDTLYNHLKSQTQYSRIKRKILHRVPVWCAGPNFPTLGIKRLCSIPWELQAQGPGIKVHETRLIICSCEPKLVCLWLRIEVVRSVPTCNRALIISESEVGRNLITKKNYRHEFVMQRTH